MIGRFALTLLVASLIGFGTAVNAQVTPQSSREAMYRRYARANSLVVGGRVVPHWIENGASFWYAAGSPGNTVIYEVDPVHNTKRPLFDAGRLRAALSQHTDHDLPGAGLPFQDFTFLDDRSKVRFAVGNDEFILDLDTYAVSRVPRPPEDQRRSFDPRVARESRHFIPRLWEILSPDSAWFATLRDYDLALRSTTDDSLVQRTSDGFEGYEWGFLQAEEAGPWAAWSPDASRLAVKKVDSRGVRPYPVVDWVAPVVEVEWAPFPFAWNDGPLRRSELFIVDVASHDLVRVDVGDEPDQYVHIVQWLPDGSELLFLRVNRTFDKLDLMAADPTTGSTRVVLSESQDTFILGEQFSYQWPQLFTLLDDGTRFIWMSERDGWNHLYLYDLHGTEIRQLTAGAFPVFRVVAVDEEARKIFFTALGDRRRPYDIHVYRVGLDGDGFERLTDAPGEHSARFAPSKKYFLDSHSSSERPRSVDLRTADGELLQTLEEANIDALAELGWSPPEAFVVKAADGETDLYGLLFKPYDFDPSQRYPVIDFIYGGPNEATVPNIFWFPPEPHAMAQLGFVTMLVDGRGTPGRGKEFQDVVYGNFGRNEIPDHVAALQNAAATRPYMDLDRVGITGGSWGGYFTIRAMLTAPEVYHVGVAHGGLAEALGSTPAEPYLGLLEENREAYEYASNVRLAGNLQGKLMLAVGTNDPLFEQNMKMANAFIQAGKPFDMMVLPGEGHGFGEVAGEYYRAALGRYFLEHLIPRGSDRP